MRRHSLDHYKPAVKYVHRWEGKEKFSQYESVHPDWLIFAVEDGAFYYKIGEQEGSAAFGDLVFCPPGTVFRRVVISPVTLLVIFLEFTDRSGCELSPGESRLLPSGKTSLRDTARLASSFRLINRLYPPDTEWSTHNLHHYVQDLWLQLCHEQDEAPEISELPMLLAGTDPAASGPPASAKDPLAREAAARIMQEACSPLRLQDIADSLEISLPSLSKRFKKSYGCTPIQYLTGQRMQKARTLLLESGLTIDQISECCGYQNGFYLTRVFIKQYGMTPAQFRKQHRI
ncbi:MAG: AraC family transcriptional regulator [Paenibacillaceae bacterium]|jgi:AraC-like DNA-binding protein|nr:AraC family transcriptional regulator [Paenibacillaceae bacterium]